MLDSDEEKRKRAARGEEDDDVGRGESGESGESGEGGHAGGQGGAIAFRDFVFVQDDRNLSPEQERLLLVQHQDANGGFVEKQKKLREQRQDRKEGRTAHQQFGTGMAERAASFLKHPILGEAAEFDGIDPKVNLDPTLYEADTNSEKQEELVYEHQLRLRLENQPHFNPKPSPF